MLIAKDHRERAPRRGRLQRPENHSRMKTPVPHLSPPPRCRGRGPRRHRRPPGPAGPKAAILYALDHNYAILQAREQIREQEGVILQVKARGSRTSRPRVVPAQRQAISEVLPGLELGVDRRTQGTQTLFAGGGVEASVRTPGLTGTPPSRTSRRPWTRRSSGSGRRSTTSSSPANRSGFRRKTSSSTEASSTTPRTSSGRARSRTSRSFGRGRAGKRPARPDHRPEQPPDRDRAAPAGARSALRPGPPRFRRSPTAGDPSISGRSRSTSIPPWRRPTSTARSFSGLEKLEDAAKRP